MYITFVKLYTMHHGRENKSLLCTQTNHCNILISFLICFQALTVPELDEVGTLRKPDFITHPHRYFADREEAAEASSRGNATTLTTDGMFENEKVNLLLLIKIL